MSYEYEFKGQGQGYPTGIKAVGWSPGEKSPFPTWLAPVLLLAAGAVVLGWMPNPFGEPKRKNPRRRRKNPGDGWEKSWSPPPSSPVRSSWAAALTKTPRKPKRKIAAKSKAVTKSRPTTSRQGKSQPVAIISFKTRIIHSIHPSMTAADKTMDRLRAGGIARPTFSHYMQDAEPGWEKGMKVGDPAFSKKWMRVAKIMGY